MSSVVKKPNEAQMLMQGLYNPGTNVKTDNKQNWDDLKSIYTSCSEALVIANNSVVELFKIPGVIDHIPNRQETKISILGLNKDIKFFSEELLNIFKLHETKTGLVNDEEDLGQCLQIFEMYHNFQSRYQSVIIPTVLVLSEQVGLAAEAMRKIIAEEEMSLTPEQDPNVTTDVEAKIPTVVETVIVEENKDQTNV